MTLSLRARLLLGLVVLVVAGMAVSAAATYTFLQRSLISELDTTIYGGVLPAAGYMSGGPGEHPPSQRDFGNLPIGTYIELRDQDGRTVLYPLQQLHYLGTAPTSAYPDLPGTLSPHGIDEVNFATIRGENGVGSYRMAYVRLSRGSVPNAVVIVAAPMTGVDSTLSQLLILEVSISALVVLAMVVLAWLIVRAGLRPLEKMGETAQAIAAGDLARRVEPANEATEIGRLGVALNRMLGQIETAFAERTRSEQRLRRFIADASHELRTPLTSIRGYAELLRRGADSKPADASIARRRIEQESVRMTGLVEDMLLLARLDQGRPLERESVNLAQIANDSCHDARAVSPTRQITVDAPDPIVVTGDEQRLRQVVGNLVRNAIVHTPPTTLVEVSVAARDGHAVLSVVDHGPGLDKDVAARVFEPFFRADAGRSRDRGGSGLGLSIVAAVVAAHSGEVDVRETPGGGATFMVELPLAGQAALPAASRS
jgi:two-component system OmpR family sensor kinase